MHDVILWCGFLGAWLLVAGPVYQAGQELAEEEFERERFQEKMTALPPPAPVSPWWWLLPPVHLYLSRRLKERWQKDFLLVLTDQEYDAVNSFFNKAYGWAIVGAGGFLIASKETYELVEGNEWRLWVFWVLLLLGLAASLGHTVFRGRLDARITEDRRTALAAGGRRATAA
jgi:hypothetical protein